MACLLLYCSAIVFKPISVANWLPSVLNAVGWVIWPVKIVPEMTYKVSSGTLNLCSLTHSLYSTLHCIRQHLCVVSTYQSHSCKRQRDHSPTTFRAVQM